MPEFFSYDPHTGIRRDFEYDQITGLTTVYTQQDIEPLLKRQAEMRNTGSADKELKKDDYFCHYASIPMVVVMELKKKGIDVMGEHDGKALMREINTNYPYLKGTTLVHDR